MGKTVRVFDGRFGRLVLTELLPGDKVRSRSDPAIVMEQGGEQIAFLNPGEIHVRLEASGGATRTLVFHAAGEWLEQSFPAVFGDSTQRPFEQPREAITPRIRRLADTLSVEVLNDRFLSAERLEFMLQELMLLIIETYIALQREGPLWHGSRFEDSRIRRAITLLRARPNKDCSMRDLANQVGLSRSRFYDLFELCTGFSPRAYLNMLCVETAISRLSSEQSNIAEVAADLGFSAPSNFTRFFLNQVGVPPSEYRRSAADLDASWVPIPRPSKR